MPVTLTATAGAHTANTYVSLADAKTILGDYLTDTTSAWDAATDDDKSRALIMATRHIDSLRLYGEKYYGEYYEGSDSYQPLHFPTVDDTDDDGDLYIPAAVERATSLQAAFILRNGANAVASSDLASTGVKSTSIGRFSQTYSITAQKTVCSEARALLAPWIIRSIPIARG
jgi:hypothetical protein